MYTRIVEITSKSGKSRELCNMIEEKVVPIPKKQTGFLDETALVSDTEPNQVLGLSFWNSKEDAERYHREQYPKIHEMLTHVIETEPAIRTFEVQASTNRQITAKAAKRACDEGKARSPRAFPLSVPVKIRTAGQTRPGRWTSSA